MTLDSFIKGAIKREDKLFLTIYRFNEMISEYVEQSHVMKVPGLGEQWMKLMGVGRIQEKLSRLLVKYFDLENRPFYGFEDPRLRVALLDNSTLYELLISAGAVIYSERISKVVMKKDVLALKESIGEDMYFFASKKASLLTGFAPRVELPGEENAITKQALFEAGRQCLQMCLAQEDDRLLKRLVLKFPSDIKWDFEAGVMEEQKTKAWNYLYRILIKEVKPDIQVCFT